MRALITTPTFVYTGSMRTFSFIRIALTGAVFGCLVLALGAGRGAQSKQPAIHADVLSAIEITAAEPAPAVNNSTYYTVRPDVRRCVSPMCGGYWVSRVNQSLTRCSNGSWRPECYVAEIDWKGAVPVEARGALLRGTVVARKFRHFGNLGTFRATESWRGATDKPPAGLFYRIRDRGLRCITHPCLTHVEMRLNARTITNIAGVDFESLGVSDELISKANTAMMQPLGLIVTGNHAVVTGPGGKAETLKATQFYLFVDPSEQSPTAGMNPCIKTGCSGELCTDQNMASPCIYRPEFACYHNATCARQDDGKCGFTKTPELTACLSRFK